VFGAFERLTNSEQSAAPTLIRDHSKSLSLVTCVVLARMGNRGRLSFMSHPLLLLCYDNRRMVIAGRLIDVERHVAIRHRDCATAERSCAV
jgi:hypothetical protein